MPDATAVKQSMVRMVRSRLSLQLSLGAAILLTADFAWLLSHAEKWDTPSQVPALFLCELPLLLCLYFLITGNKQKREIRGAGITFGVALSFCVLSPLFFFILLMTIWGTGDRYLKMVAVEHVLPICVLIALAVMALAWTHGEGNRAPFVKAAGVGAGCFFATSLLIFSFCRQRQWRFEAESCLPGPFYASGEACFMLSQPA